MRRYGLLVAASIVASIAVGVGYGQSAHAAYSADYAGARAWGDDFCSQGGNFSGVGDYVWVTAPDGSNTVTAMQGDPTVTVRVHAGGKYCQLYRSQGAGSNYSSSIGSINGTFLQYSNNGPSRYFGGPGDENIQDKQMDIRSLSAGTYTVSMTLNTFTWSPALPPKASPSADSVLTLVITQPWTTTATTQVGVNRNPDSQNATAKPGQKLNWWHTITASGGTAPGRNFNVNKSGFVGANVWGDGSAANNGDPVGTTSAIPNGGSYRIGYVSNYPQYAEYTVKQDDGGRVLCQRLAWGPSDYTMPANAAWSQTVPACVTVPFNYDLTPTVTGPSGDGVVGSPIGDVSPNVNNNVPGDTAGTTDSPSNIEWQLKRVEVEPGQSIPMTQQENSSIPCTHYRSGGASKCIDKGSGTQSFPKGSTPLAMLSGETIPVDAKAGTRICYTLSVRPYSQVNNNWRHGVPVCIKVSKQPKLQIWGGDLRTRGQVRTSSTVVSPDGRFGSWVEYGAFAAGTITAFASGSGLNNGNKGVTDSAWNALTFANIDSSNNAKYGSFNNLPALPDLASQFSTKPASGGALSSNLSTLGSGVYKRTGNFTITGGDIAKGTTIIIVATGKVTIEGNITYRGTGANDTFSSISELPQVIIIADTIDIKNDATQVDAWLLTTSAAGGINTCSEPPLGQNLTISVCDKQLIINGPVVTDHLYLRRTVGADGVTDAGKAAEIFNLRPDAYLWAQSYASRSGKAQTVYSVELPPRF